jgi:RNA polymerase sigma factor (sigma-70 family)
MDSRTDQELLQEYAEKGSDSAFSEIVRRYLDFVYSAALRLAGNSHLAEDISQRVFLALARGAHQLTDRAILAGWLHLTARNVTANAIRTEVRRRAWEQEAAAMNQLLTPDNEPAWESIAPHLDDAIGRLNEADRDAIFLRYFQRKSACEMAQSLGISSEAAQKRVNRAIERLRGLFAQHGIATGAGALAVLLSANAVKAAPPSLSLAISATAVAGASLSTSATISTAKIILMTTLQKALIASAVVAVVGGGIYETQKHARAHSGSNSNRRRHVSARRLPSGRVTVLC